MYFIKAYVLPEDLIDPLHDILKLDYTKIAVVPFEDFIWYFQNATPACEEEINHRFIIQKHIFTGQNLKIL